MAGDWIKFQHATLDKPEIYGIASILRVTPEDAVGRCLRLWVWADQQSLNGHALTVTNVTLDSVTRMDGFATALVKVGWLIDNGDGTITLPNFDRHNGETSKNRSLSADRKKKQRAKEQNGHGEVVTSVMDLSRDKRDVFVTREEKRREEESTPPIQGGDGYYGVRTQGPDVDPETGEIMGTPFDNIVPLAGRG